MGGARRVLLACLVVALYPAAAAQAYVLPATGISAPTDPTASTHLRVLLAWSPDVLPARTARALERSGLAHDSTTVDAGLDWLVSSSKNGHPVDSPPSGYEIPFEVAFIHPSGYAHFVPARYRSLVRALGGDEMLIPDTESRLRGAGTGLRARLYGRTVHVAGVIGDHAAQGYEGLLRGRQPSLWRAPDRFVLMHLAPDASRKAVRRKIMKISPSGLRLQLRSKGQKPFLRYADSVRPQLLYKDAFGEFPARRSSSGALGVPSKWTSRHIVTTNVPLLGSVHCHRKLIPMLRAAMSELRRKGLGSLVKDYAGCYSARSVRDDPAYRLSHHSWGAAVDINVGDNPLGAPPHQDPRLVRIMAKHGFTWGGKWIRPDGMHFEWWHFPS